MDLAERVAWAIKQTGDKHEVLVKRLGVSLNTITAYKRGKGDLKGSVLAGLVSHYGFSPEWLLTGEGRPYLNKQDRPPDVEGLNNKNLIKIQYIEIIKQFKNEKRAKDANLALLKIEHVDPDLFEKLVSHIEGVEWSLRMKAPPYMERRSGTDRRKAQTDQKGPKSEERRKGDDRRKSTWGE